MMIVARVRTNSEAIAAHGSLKIQTTAKSDRHQNSEARSESIKLIVVVALQTQSLAQKGKTVVKC